MIFECGKDEIVAARKFLGEFFELQEEESANEFEEIHLPSGPAGLIVDVVFILSLIHI